MINPTIVKNPINPKIIINTMESLITATPAIVIQTPNIIPKKNLSVPTGIVFIYHD